MSNKPGRISERLTLLLSMLVLAGSLIGVYAKSVEANAQQELRLDVVEASVKLNASKRELLNQEFDDGLEAVTDELQNLKTNTVLICNKLQIDRCK